jgi:hypothetical protein
MVIMVPNGGGGETSFDPMQTMDLREAIPDAALGNNGRRAASL